LVVVGVGGWDDYTRPCIESLKKHHPQAELILVDNGSQPAYPHARVRFDRTVGYAEAMNAGLRAAKGAWLMPMNNDVICTGTISLPKHELAVYGAELNSNTQIGTYIEGWVFLFHRSVWEALGPFDENFRVVTYEDVDYSYRARQSDLPLAKIDLPLRHAKHGFRGDTDQHADIRRENREYFMKKHKLS